MSDVSNVACPMRLALTIVASPSRAVFPLLFSQPPRRHRLKTVPTPHPARATRVCCASRRRLPTKRNRGLVAFSRSDRKGDDDFETTRWLQACDLSIEERAARRA